MATKAAVRRGRIERVPKAWSAWTYLALAVRNRSWRDLDGIDQVALQRLAIDADDRGIVRVPTRHAGDPACALCSAVRLRAVGFLRTLTRGGTARRLVLPAHRAYLTALDRRREAFRVETPSEFLQSLRQKKG